MGHVLRPDLVLLLTVAPSAGIDRISRRARVTGELTSLSAHMIANPEAFAACEELLRNQAAQLGAVVEIDTTNLTIDQACNAAAAGVATLGIQEWTGAATRG